MSLSVAERVLERVERLADITACPGILTRYIFTPEQLQAESLVQGWMEEAGLTVRRDAAGNLIGRLEGSTPGAPAIVIGGHVDTYKDACRFGGVLSVLMGIACVEHLAREGLRLRSAVEVIVFPRDVADRHSGWYYGSRAMVGEWAPSWFANSDDYDVPLRQAMQAHGLDPERIGEARRDPSALAAYIEVLAEPGPILEWANSPVGIVDALTLQDVLVITLTGAFGLLSTLPMAGRRDALVGAAECVIEAERLGSSRDGVTVTAYRLEAGFKPSNVVLGSAKVGVDVASRDGEARCATAAEAEASFREIASRRGLEIHIEKSVSPDTKRCDPAVVRSFEAAARASGQRATIMGTGWTQASIMSRLAPIGLLLVRARGSTGWGPGAEVSAEDIAAGLDVLCRALPTMAETGTCPEDGRISAR